MSPFARRTLLAWGAGGLVILTLVVLRSQTRDGPLDRLDRQPATDGVAVYRGSWHFPRGGPYVLGFESPGGATLRINGRTVADGRGQVQKRIVYPPGTVAVELQATDGTRLLWHPPGRRGPLEYVMPSSLSPASPDQAVFASTAGAAVADGVVALLCLAVFLGLIGYTARRRLSALTRREVVACVAVFALALITRLIDLDGAGQTWDEDVNWTAGRNYLINLFELDFGRESWRWNYEHPPLMKYIAGIGALLGDGYGPARALSALVVAGACALVVVVVRRLYDLETAVIAGAIVALTPHLIGHGKIVGHEAPTILWWTAAVWGALHVADAEGRKALVSRLTVLGLIVGAAVFSRFVNVLMAPLIAAIVVIRTPATRRRDAILLGLVVVTGAALLVGYLSWPRLWAHPVQGLQEAWIKLRKPHSPEYYLGALTNTPSRSYFGVYLLATAPILVVLGAAGFAVAAFVRRRSSDLLLCLWLLVPMFVALSPVRQDGVRYIMPSVVALSIMAAVGVNEAARLIPKVRLRLLVPAFFGLYMAFTAWRVHPYYLDYYGEQVGGPEAVHDGRNFELAWWGEGLNRAIDYVNANAGQGDAVFKSCVVPSHLTWLRHDLWAAEARRPDRATWIIVYQPYSPRCRVPDDATKVFEVAVMGAPLAQVYRR